jgi:heme exporter protein A
MLQVKALGCQRGGAWLFRDVDFDVMPSQMVWLRGQNGTGKTSLLRLVVGLARPDEGTLQWRYGSGAGDLKNVVYVGHSCALKEDLTALESLQFLAQLHGCPSSPAACAVAMRRLDVHQRRHQLVRTLSQGQRRRVALARLALESQPSLWVLDEPFEALDAHGFSALSTLLSEHQSRGGSVLLTSHIPLHKHESTCRVLDLDDMVNP